MNKDPPLDKNTKKLNILFDPEKIDSDALEAMCRQEMESEENQAILADYLAKCNLTPDEIEAIDKENQRTPEALEAFQKAEEAFLTCEEIVCPLAFWEQGGTVAIPLDPGVSLPPVHHKPPGADTAESNGKVLLKGIDQHLAAFDVDDSEHPSPYETAQWIIQNVHVIHAGGVLYFYGNGAHLPCKAEEAKQRILEFCRPAVKCVGKPPFVSQVYEFLRMEPQICRDADLELNVVSLDDGLLDLDTWTLLPHDPEMFVTTRLRASFGVGCRTECPEFNRFLEAISCGDENLVQRLWQCIGYLLVPDQTGKRFVLFQGVSNSGKSVLGRFIQGCFLGDVTATLEINELRGQFTLSELVGKKFCSDMDLPAEPLNERALGKLKKITGGDQVSSDVKFADRVNFACTAKFLFGSNHAVLLRKKDPAFLNRLVVVPFARAFNGQAQDHALPDKLARERDAIVVRALAAYRQLAQQGFCFSGNYAVNQVLGCDIPDSAEDAVSSFLKNCCERADDIWTSTEQLFESFVEVHGEVCKKGKFSELLLKASSAAGIPVEKERGRLSPGANPVQGFSGLKLKD